MLAAIHWNLDPVLGEVLGIQIRYYSLCWVIGFLLGYHFVRKRFIKEGRNLRLLEPLAFYVFISALVGARLGHCFFYEFQYYSHHLLEIILPVKFTDAGIKFTGYAGLASHGGVIGIFIALFLFHKKYKVSFLSLCDDLAYVAPLGGACIRVGNFFNSEIVGTPASVPWAIVFTRVDNLPRHPAQLYEAVSYLLIFIVLYLVLFKSKKQYNQGLIFGLSVFLIFFSRFVIEYVKIDQVPFEAGMRATLGMNNGQLLSLPLILVGLFFWIRAIRKP